MNLKIGIAGLCLAAFSTSCSSTFEPAEIAPTPQRPKISRNTQTTAKDSVEIETGITVDPNDFVDTTTTLKYGLTESTEYFMDFAPFRYIDSPGDNETGVGDVTLGLRHRFKEGADGEPSFAYEFFGKFPTGDDEDGVGTGGRDFRLPTFLTGSTDLRLAGIVEQQRGDLNIAGYGAVQANGSPFRGTVYQLMLASHATMPITDADTVFGEIVGTFTEGFSSEFLAQAGIYRRIKGNMTADAAVGFGLEKDAPAFFFMLGLTTNLGYLR